MFDDDRQLRIPGPTPIPPAVAEALARPMLNHRGAAFRAELKRACQGLAELLGCPEPVAILTGSGTAAMEAAVANLVAPGERVLALVGGKFGERWAEVARAFEADVKVFEFPWEGGADPGRLAEVLAQDPAIACVLATYNESSTGVLNDVAALSAARQGHRALLVVDAVSVLGGAPLPMARWGVDCVVAGSQKCLMLPPGLSFVALSERAWQRLEGRAGPRYYLDLRAYRRAYADGETPYTPAVPLVRGLNVALELLAGEGHEEVYRRHRLMRDMVRAAVRALGLLPWTEDRWASPTVTSVRSPDGLDVEGLRRRLRDGYGIELSGGQGHLRGRMFRIGHMGYATPLDMVAVLAGLEQALAEAGHPVTLGAGLAAAQEVWRGCR